MGNTYDRIGRVYLRKSRWKQAQAAFTEAVLVKKSHFGDSHLETAACLENIATTHFELGHFDECLILLVEVLRIRRIQLNESDNSIVATLKKIGNAYLKNGNGLLASQIFEEAIDLEEKNENRSLPSC